MQIIPTAPRNARLNNNHNSSPTVTEANGFDRSSPGYKSHASRPKIARSKATPKALPKPSSSPSPDAELGKQYQVNGPSYAKHDPWMLVAEVLPSPITNDCPEDGEADKDGCTDPALAFLSHGAPASNRRHFRAVDRGKEALPSLSSRGLRDAGRTTSREE